MKIAERSLKQVENTVGKGEIARYEQFLLFPQCFQKACFPGSSKGVIVWEWVKLRPKNENVGYLKPLTLYETVEYDATILRGGPN